MPVQILTGKMESMEIYEKLSFQFGHFVYHGNESTMTVLEHFGVTLEYTKGWEYMHKQPLKVSLGRRSS